MTAVAAWPTTHALLAGAIDYAGLYPPASHDEPTTVAQYSKLLSSGGAWAAGRLVWPAARLAALGDVARGHAPDVVPPVTEGAWAVSAVTPPVSQRADFDAALAAVDAFNERHAEPGAPAMRVDCLEIKVDSARDLESVVDSLPDCFVYWEVPPADDPRGVLTMLAEDGFGAKIRTGGTTAAAHPSVERVASFIQACALGRVPFKATAGLHRAARHHVPSMACEQHGFLNVFVGAAMAFAGALDQRGLVKVLSETDPKTFAFDSRGVTWRDASITVAQVVQCREHLLHSFGSCSIDEPLGDLLALGLISAKECA